MYPCPVSTQVALPAHGLDEHRRVSVFKKVYIFRYCVRSPSSSFPVSLPVFLLSLLFPLSCSHSHHSILSPREKKKQKTTVHRLAAHMLQQNMRYTVCVLARRSNCARSQKKTSFPHLNEGQRLLCKSFKQEHFKMKTIGPL